MSISLEKPDPADDPINGVAQDWCEERGLGRLPASLARTIFDLQDPRIPCESCGVYEGIGRENGRTEYHWEGAWDDPENPNRDVWLCPGCAADHHGFWDDMWEEYYASRG